MNLLESQRWRRDQLVDPSGTDVDVAFALGHHDPEVRAAAAEVAGERRIRTAYPQLDACVDDDDVAVRVAAVVALGRLGNPRCIPLLEAHLEIDVERHGANATNEFRRALLWSLHLLGRRTDTTDACMAWTMVGLGAASLPIVSDRADTRLRADLFALTTPFVVLYSGRAPRADVVRRMIETMASPPSREPVDLFVVDDDRDVTFSRFWHSLARSGLSATTAAPDTIAEDAPRRMVVIRRSSLDIPDQPRVKRAWQRPTWWMAALVAGATVVADAAEIATSAPPTASEAPWLAAAAGGADAVGDAGRLAGSALWPTIVRPLYATFGVDGVRTFSLVMSVVAIAAAAAATSRLFGRWAARAAAAVLAITLSGLGFTTQANAAPFAAAGLALALLAIAIVEHHQRRSWVLMAGIASAIAVIAWYPAVVFVVVLTWFFTLLRGRTGAIDSTAFRLIVIAGLLAWFLPTRDATLSFVRDRYDDGGWLTVIGDTAMWLTGIAALYLAVLIVVRSRVVRRRVAVLTTSLLAVPMAGMLAGPGGASEALAVALVLVIPALAGALIFPIAAWRRGSTALPAPRITPELLVVDASAGRLVGRMVRYPNWQVRLVAPLLIVSSLFYLPWAAMHIEMRNWWLAIPFLLANGFMVASAMLSVFNNWTRAVPIPVEVAAGHEPLVGVIVPTCGEPVHMVMTTARTILDQDWPIDRLRIVVSDDAHSDDMRDHVEALAALFPSGVVSYHRPPKRGEPTRRGDSKSGNLNSAIEVLDGFGCEYIETRDADDMVGTREFLRATIAHMIDDPGVGFVQTVKRTRTSPGDPFNNNEPFFYRGTMLARNADNAIFPCGSGLVWRRSALASIGEFPAWNLVEDLHSGVLGLRAGWRGLYVPIVGAVAQHSPEDVANAFKQRGTWALDTTRLLAFDRFKGIGWKARLHFLEQAIFYLQSFALLTLFLVPAIGLAFDRFPLVTDSTTYAVRFWGFALAIELALLALAADQPTGSLWRSRLSWVGLSPVYVRAALKALRYGPNRKPAYKVTRKTDEYQVYIRLVIAHWLVAIALVVGLIVAVVRDSIASDLDLGSVYWAIVGLVGLGAFLRLSWFGVDLRERWASKRANSRLLRLLPGSGGSRSGRVQSAA